MTLHGALWLDVVARTRHPKSLQVYQARGGQLPRPEPTVVVHEYSAGCVAVGDGWQCIAHEVRHAQPYLACYGFRFETDAGIIAFSGDAAPDDRLLDLARGADLFVMAVMGFALPENRRKGAEIVRQAGVGHLVVNHQAPAVAADAENVLADIRAVYLGTLSWGKDFMEVTF